MRRQPPIFTLISPFVLAAVVSGCGSELGGSPPDTRSDAMLDAELPDADVSDTTPDIAADAPDAPDAPDVASDDSDIPPDTSETTADAVPDALDSDAPDLLDAETPPEDTAAETDTTQVAPSIGIVTWTIRTGDDGSVDDAPGIAYCLSATHCAVPENALNWNDRDPRDVDVWHTPGAAFSTAAPLTRDDIDRIELRFASPDAWSVSCIQVAIDGETIHCAMTDTLLGLAPGTDAEAVFTTSPSIECDTCWDGVLTHGPVIGATSDRDAHLWVRTDSSRLVALRVASSVAALRTATPRAYATPQARDDYTHTFFVADLQPSTTYYFDLDVGGRRYPGPDDPPYQFRTAPSAGGPAHFSFGLGSCARADIDKVPTQPAFAALETLAPDFFLFVGDNVYFDPLANGEITNVSGARSFYREALQRTFSWASPAHDARADFGRDSRATFLAHTPMWGVWDDHDFLHDYSYGVAFGVPDPNRIWARQVFMEYWPNGRYGDGTDGIYSRFSWGDVDVFLVDGRYFRDIDHTSLLGTAQRDWLYDALDTSTATFKIIVDGSDWSAESIGDSWAGWPVDRRGLFEHLVSAHIEGVVFVSGDSHRSELRVLPGADGGYPMPALISSGIATVIRGCPATNEFFEVSGNSSCYGADTGATTNFITVDVDTTRADPQMSAVIRDVNGVAQRTFTFQASDLTFQPRVPLPRRGADFDGDGYADLAIGVPFEDTNAPDDGLVHVFYGTNGGLHTADDIVLTQAALSGANEADDQFGAALAQGDLDGDGFDDLVVGVPGEDYGNHPGTGRAVVLRGSARGLVLGPETLDIEADATPLIDQRMGASLAVGDFDGDGKDDVAIGCPGDGGGAVRIFRGNGGPLLRAARLAFADLPGHTSAKPAGLGAALAVGDFDGDGFEDLAIGLPLQSTAVASEIGQVVIAYGSDLGLSFSRTTLHAPGDVGLAVSSGLHFGASLVAGDLDADGIDDLAIGVPGAASSSGRVARILGVRGAGLADNGIVWSLPSLVPGNAAQANDALGSSLAIGDFDHDGKDDLAIGTPGDVVNGILAAGVVDVIPGRPDGFDAPLRLYGMRMTQRWNQALNALAGGGGPEANDQLGTALGR